MTEQTAPVASPKVRRFKLDHNIVVAGEVVHKKGDTIAIRKPYGGEFRGVQIVPLSQLDYAQMEKIAPRITEPMLTKQIFAAMESDDILQFGGELMDFLLPTAAKEAVSPTE
nr:phage tail assembly protein [uncultured Sphingomonas sp.]